MGRAVDVHLERPEVRASEREGLRLAESSWKCTEGPGFILSDIYSKGIW